MGPHKRMLLWDYTNTQGCPNRINDVPFGKGLISSVSNWNSWTPPELKNRAPFRPMLHDLAKVPPTNDWNMFANSNDPILLYLNEPERDNRTPQQAADVWTRDVIPLRQKKHCRLCSPSCANDPKGQNWLKDWMNIVRGRNQMPDFIGVHWYGESADDCKKFLEGIHNQWPGIPIMVTEIASISRDYNSVLHFTADMVNWMDGISWISEYAFFGCMRHVADNFVSPAAQLMNPDGSFKDLMYKLMYDQPIKV